MNIPITHILEVIGVVIPLFVFIVAAYDSYLRRRAGKDKPYKTNWLRSTCNDGGMILLSILVFSIAFVHLFTFLVDKYHITFS